jgi:tetratricopeptide (TPR) repeat protein
MKYTILVFVALLFISAQIKTEETDTATPEQLNNMAITFIDAQQFDSAIFVFNRLIRLQPNYPDAYYNRGGCKQIVNKHHSAIEDFDNAIQLKPKDPDIYFIRGISKYEIKAYRGAIQDFTKVLELDPAYTDAYYDRAMCEEALEEYETACKDYHEAYNRGLKDAKQKFKSVCKK